MFIWFIEWPAYALSHLLNPLYSTAANFPGGVNLLANTSELAIGVVLAPITWVFGPVTSFNVALTLAPVLSALAMFVLLRRWISWTPAAFLGGLFYGFSPFSLVYLSDGHLMLGFAALPPLIIVCLDELVVTQRRRPVTTGILLGVLVALQFFLGTEILFILAIFAVVAAVVIVMRAGLRRTAFRRDHLRFVGVGLLAGASTSAVLLAYPTWFALAGPAHLSGPVWPGGFFFGGGTTSLKSYVIPPNGNPYLNGFFHSIGGYQGPLLSSQYFGLGLVIVVIAGCIVWRHDGRLLLFSAIGTISIALSAGVNGHFLLKLGKAFPLIDDIEPNHIVIVTCLAFAITLGLILDHIYVAVDRHRESTADSWWVGGIAAMVVATAALAPPAYYLAQTIPMTTQSVVLPEWFRAVAPHVRARQIVLTFPSWFTSYDTAMTWQAVDQMHFSMIGEAAPAGLLERVGPARPGAAVISRVSLPSGAAVIAGALPSETTPAVTSKDVLSVRQSLETWGVTTVVIPDQPSLPSYDQIPSVTRAAALMTAAIGERPVHQAGAWVWTGVARSGEPVPVDADRFSECTAGLARGGTVAVHRSTSCIMASSTGNSSAIVGP